MEKSDWSAEGRQDSRRTGQLTIRVFLLSLFLVFILSLFFHQFNRKLEQSLWEEKQAQYQYLADQSAQLVSQQINEDQRVLQSMVEQIASLNLDNAMVVLDESNIQWGKAGDYPSIARSGDHLQYAAKADLADGTCITLFHTVSTKTYDALLGTLFAGKPFTGYWIKPEGTLLWQTDGSLDGLESLSLASVETMQLFTSKLDGGWGQFVLVANRGLSESVSLAILRSSLSMAAMVIVIFFLFLVYLLSMDHRYART